MERQETPATLEERALADYAAVLGRVFTAREVQGFVGEDSVEVVCDPPALARVVQSDTDGDVCRRQDDWIDPCWNVELVEPHPQLEGVRGLWVYGTSYALDGEVDRTGLRPAPDPSETDGRPAWAKPTLIGVILMLGALAVLFAFGMGWTGRFL